MRLRLTPQSAKSLPAAEGRRADYYDSVRRGLVLRVSPSGERRWYLSYSRRGAARKLRLGDVDEMTLAEAREEARRLLIRVGLGEDPAAVRAAERIAGLSVAAVVREALRHLRLSDRTRREWQRLADVEVIPRLGDTPAAQLSRSEIRDWGARLARRSPTTAAHAFEFLRRCYSWAVEHDVLHGTPFVHLQPPAVRAASTRVLSTPELWALQRAIAALPGAYSDAVELLLLTLARREMVLGARRAELDLEAKLWRVPAARMKARLDHLIPLSPRAVSAFKRRTDDAPGDVLFPPLRRDSDSATMGWNSDYVLSLKAKCAAALHVGPWPRWTIHNLRHTGATHLREDLGVDRDVVRLLLAHHRRDVSGRYDRAEMLDQRRAALDSWDTWLAAIPRPGSVPADAPAGDPGSTRKDVA